MINYTLLKSKIKNIYYLYFILSFFIIKTFAQDSVLDDVSSLLDVEDTQEEKVDAINTNELFGGKLSNSYTFSSVTERHSEALSLYWEKKVNDLFSFKTELRVINSQISNTLDVVETNTVTGERTESSRVDTLSSFEVEPRDFYIQFNSNNWQATIGWQAFTIGVGTLSSPIDFILVPDRSDALPINLNRIDGKLSQPIVKLNYNNSGVNFTYYYHPIFTLDKFTKQQFEKEENGIKPQLPKTQRHLIRLSYRKGNHLTGFTFYKGPNTKFFSDIYRVQNRVLENGVRLVDNIFEDRKFADYTVLSWEYAYTKKKWRYSAEITSVNGLVDQLPQQGLIGPSGSPYNDFIINSNNGLLSDDEGSVLAINLGF